MGINLLVTQCLRSRFVLYIHMYVIQDRQHIDSAYSDDDGSLREIANVQC